MTATSTTDARRIVSLANSFPGLQRAPGVAHHWDATSLDRWASTVASSGERHAARFVLGVWNSDEPWECGRFDVLRALRTWDRAHRQAFLAWAVNPWFC